jgi:hypothetical protein
MLVTAADVRFGVERRREAAALWQGERSTSALCPQRSSLAAQVEPVFGLTPFVVVFSSAGKGDTPNRGNPGAWGRCLRK